MDAKRSCMVKTLNIMDANIKGFTGVGKFGGEFNLAVWQPPNLIPPN